METEEKVQVVHILTLDFSNQWLRIISLLDFVDMIMYFNTYLLKNLKIILFIIKQDNDYGGVI